MDSKLDLLMVLVPGLPLAAAILIGLFGARSFKNWSHLPVILALAGSCVASVMLLKEVHQRQTVSSDSVVAGQSEQAGLAPSVEQHGYEHVVRLWTWARVPSAYNLQVTPPGQFATNNGAADAAATSASGPQDFAIEITLRADALTSIMLTMVTFISTLVAIFAAGYMKGDDGYWRFFAYIGLFVFSMTMLVSVSNFALLFVFWEAVGVCSYLLIGFWYPKPEAAAAGKKAFLVNRVGDFGFALALFLIWTTYGTLDFHDATAARSISDDSSAATAGAEVGLSPSDSQPARGILSPSRIAAGDYRTGAVGLAICLLLMLGACGKSAQFPLHVWLPDAMEGPTPVSALIHAATMVTAGVYMVTRCTPLFMASPDAQAVVAIIGGFTALLAGLIALTQNDLKRVLAYSTVSQLGYMFLALGTGTLAGVTAGMFHLFTHAFFKALLFLGSGSVMHAMGHIIDMRRFSGLRRLMPWTHATFLVGCLALAGVPPLSGFWSKDVVIASVHDKAGALSAESAEQFGESGGTAVADGAFLSRESLAAIYEGLYVVALVVALLTAFYTFRAFFMTFYGPLKVPSEAGDHAHESPSSMIVPLVVLGIFAAFVGLYLEVTHGFAHFLAHVPSLAGGSIASTEAPGKFHLTVAATSTVVAGAGIMLAVYLYLGDNREVRWLARLFNLEGLSRWLEVDRIARWKEQPIIASVHRGARRVGLGWLTALVGYAVLLLALILSAPLLVGYYISPYRLSYRKFFWDEIYQVLIVTPLEWLAKLCAWIDRWVIDGSVNLVGRVPVMLGSFMRSLQMGLVPFYGLAMILGALILVATRLLWGPGS